MTCDLLLLLSQRIISVSFVTNSVYFTRMIFLRQQSSNTTCLILHIINHLTGGLTGRCVVHANLWVIEIPPGAHGRFFGTIKNWRPTSILQMVSSFLFPWAVASPQSILIDIFLQVGNN
uniref:Uncharacterized protein n=1 Tax=Schistocephalus solidus TaxID=70667 RepID=A0A0X3NUU4_SCHSO